MSNPDSLLSGSRNPVKNPANDELNVDIDVNSSPEEPLIRKNSKKPRVLPGSSPSSSQNKGKTLLPVHEEWIPHSPKARRLSKTILVDELPSDFSALEIKKN